MEEPAAPGTYRDKSRPLGAAAERALSARCFCAGGFRFRAPGGYWLLVLLVLGTQELQDLFTAERLGKIVALYHGDA